MSKRYWNEKSYRVNSKGCWIWQGNIRGNGYGAYCINKKGYYAHRYLYEKLKGPIPKGLQLDHLCRNKLCVNTGHLEPVTSRENTMRGIGLTSINAKKTHCHLGHLLSGKNLYRRPDRERECRICTKNRRNLYTVSNII